MRYERLGPYAGRINWIYLGRICRIVFLVLVLELSDTIFPWTGDVASYRMVLDLAIDLLFVLPFLFRCYSPYASASYHTEDANAMRRPFVPSSGICTLTRFSRHICCCNARHICVNGPNAAVLPWTES